MQPYRASNLDVEEILGQDVGPLIDGFSRSVEDSAKHVFGNGHAKNIASELACRMLGVDTGSTFKHLAIIIRHISLIDLFGVSLRCRAYVPLK